MEHDLDGLTVDQLSQICAEMDSLDDVSHTMPRTESFDSFVEISHETSGEEIITGTSNVSSFERPCSSNVRVELASTSMDVSNFLRSYDIFKEKGQRNHRFIQNAVDYLKIINKRKTQHQCDYDIYAPDLYLENKSFFDVHLFNFSSNDCSEKELIRNKQAFSRYAGTPLAMRSLRWQTAPVDERLKSPTYFQVAESWNMRQKPSPSCYTCKSLSIACSSFPGNGRCYNCDMRGEGMVCVFEGKWVPYVRLFPNHQWYDSIMNCEEYM